MTRLFFNSVHFHKFKTAQFFQLWPINPIPGINRVKGTDGNNILHTPIVKHYNDLVGRQSSERGKDEVSYFYVGEVFVYTLGLSMPIFKKKSSQRFLGKSSKVCVLHKTDFLFNTQSLEHFPEISANIFS